MPVSNQALNAYAIGVVVSGEQQLIKLGNTITKVGGQVDALNRKMASPKGTAGTNVNANKTVQSNKKVMTSSDKRRKKIERDQSAERKSMNATNARIRAQSQRFEKYNRKIQTSSRLTKNEITDMFRRVALWSTGIGVLFGTLSKVKFIFGAVKDLEVQMAELKKVMDDDTPFKTAQRALFQTALSMSVAVDKAAEIAKTWAQQGYELKEVAELTKIALLGVNAANLTAGQSVEFLTSAIKSFKVEAEDTARVIDSIMAIQADFAITSANLAKGLQVAGAITAQLGGDMNELFGMMTAVGEITRETGNVIGNSLKTQLARIQQPRTIAYLERLGIATRRLTDEGAIKRLSAYDIFRQIAEKRQAGILTQDQVLDISLKIGGIRKFKDALILIENFDTAMEAMQTGFLAYGDAADASAVIQDTLTRKLDRLNTAFVELGAVVGELGNLEAFKWIVDGITGMVTGLSSMAKGEGFLGGAGAMAFQALPIAIIGGFAKFLGKRIFQNIRGTELRSVQEMANLGAGPLSRTQAQSRYTFFGKAAVDPKFAKAWGQEIKNISKEAKLAGINFGQAHKQLAFMSAMSKNAVGGIGGLNKSLGGLKSRALLAGRALRAGAAPGTLPGGAAVVSGRVSGGLATARIFGALGGLLKGLAATGAIILSIEGIIKLVEYIKSFKPETIDFKGTIDRTSEASKTFVALTKTLVSVKKAAKDKGLKLEEYLDTRTFSQKMLKLQPVAEEAGRHLAFSMLAGLEKAVPVFKAEAFKAFALQARLSKESPTFTESDLPRGEALEKFYDDAIEYLKKGSVKNRADFKKILTGLDIDKIEIPTEEITKKFQIAFRNLLKFEISGDVEEARVKTKRSLGLLIDEFSNSLKGKKITVDFREKGDLAKLGGIGGEGYVKAVAGEIIEAQGVMGGVLKSFSKGIKKYLPEIEAAFKKANKYFDPQQIGKTFNIKDQEDAATGFNKIFNTWKEIAKDSESLPLLSEVIGSYLDFRLGTFSGEPKARAGFVAGLDQEEKLRYEHNQAIANFNTVANERIAAFISGIKQTDISLFLATRGLEQAIENSGNYVSNAALGAAFALLRIPDEIFKATSDFVAKMEKISIKDALSGILGTTSTPSQDTLKAFRDYATNAAQIASGIRHTRRAQENIQERLQTAFTEHDADLIAIIKAVQSGSIKANQAYAELVNLQNTQESTQTQGRKKAIAETKKVITDLLKVRQQEELLRSDMSGAVNTWKDLVGLVRKTTGVDIGGEVAIKAAFEEIDKTGSTKKFEALFRILIDNLIAAAEKEIVDTKLDTLAVKFQQQANKLTSYGKRFYKTGVDIVDAQVNAFIRTQQKLQELNIDAAKIRRDISLGRGDDVEDLRANLALIEAERKATVEMSALTLNLNLMAIEADRITGATDTARRAFTQLFADVSKFDFRSNAISFAFEDAFNQIANVRLENISEKFTNSLLEGFEKFTGEQFGEFLLGEDIKDPLELNTGALDVNSMSIDQLTAAINLSMGIRPETKGLGFTADVDSDDWGYQVDRDIKNREEQTKTDKANAEKQKKFYDSLIRGFSQIAGGAAGGWAAGLAGKETNVVNIGTTLGGALGQTDWLTGILGSFAGPFGTIFGGIIGGLLGRDKEEDAQDSENLKQIASNTAALVDIDSRIINAPADFFLPASIATGGNIQWSGDIVINGDNPREIARAVGDELSKVMRGTRNYNVVSDRLS